MAAILQRTRTRCHMTPDVALFIYQKYKTIFNNIINISMTPENYDRQRLDNLRQYGVV